MLLNAFAGCEPGMRNLYNFLFTICFWLASPYYFLKMWRRGNWREGFGERFGKYATRTKHALTNRHAIWFHAVSVGEVNLCTQLIKSLEPRVPNLKIVVSTTTSTGMQELRKKLPGHIEKIYYPIDRKRFVYRAMAAIHPEAVVLVEAEIWPNFIWRLEEKRIPLFLVNARLSERSYRGYKRFGFLFRPLFAAFTGVGAQSAEDAQRLIDIGCKPEAVQVIGSLKFDAAKLDDRRVLDVPGLLSQIGVPPDAQLIVAGSTHDGEETILAELFQRLQPRFKNLFLIIVPRHFERGKEVGRQLAAAGIDYIYRSEISTRTQFQPWQKQCLLVNTTGELKFFYERATVVFIGKSLAAKGGQSPIEPAALGKAMVMGPHMQNFAAITAAFVKEGGAVQVQNADQLLAVFSDLLDNPAKREALGRQAVKVVRENLGGIERTVDMIVRHLEGGDHYLKPQPW